MKAVIMCGGSGTRLWPISKKSSPKQFAKIFNNKSLFQLTIERNMNLVDEFIIVVNQTQLNLCQEQIPSILKDKVQFIIEPIGRNTAPAITLAALAAGEDDLLILASDHLIKDQSSYELCVNKALEFSQLSNLVTFGIKPSYPETGYGYIQADGNNVISFKEKPSLETANSYLEQGNYFWNSGMFLFNSSAYLSEIEKHSPSILSEASKAMEKSEKEGNLIKISQEDMVKIPKDSVDYAVMEKSNIVKVVPSDFNWSDLGSFDALYSELERTELGNTDDDNHISINSNNNLILSNKKVIATFDVDDLIIVDTEDAILIGKRGMSQNVKPLLEQIKERYPELLD